LIAHWDVLFKNGRWEILDLSPLGMRVKAESSELFGLSSLLEAILQEIRRQAYILNIFESFVIVESSNID